MAEWSNAHDSKSCYVGTRTEVRILFSAPTQADGIFAVRLCLFQMSVRNFVGSGTPLKLRPAATDRISRTIFYVQIDFSAKT